MYCFKNGKDCPYRSICEEYKEDGTCPEMCTRFYEIDTIFYKANIPKRYLQPYKLCPDDKDIDAYEELSFYKDNIWNLVQEGFNLYLHSNVRLNGKTSWGIKILQNYIHIIRKDNTDKTRGLYVDVGEYLAQLKASFDSYDNEDIENFKRDIDSADLVVWDNIDEVKLTEWERATLRQHVKKRLANNLSNIFIGAKEETMLDNYIGLDLREYITLGQNVKLCSKRGRGAEE